MITSALRKDLLQRDGLCARISKLRYESYDLKKEDWFELCGTCMACKDKGQRLELKEIEKWYVDEVKRVKAIVAELHARAKRTRGRSPIAKEIYPSQKIW